MSQAQSGWKALVHVRPARQEHCLSDSAGGAYVCVLGLGHGESHFREMVSAEMDSLGLLALDFADVETFDSATEVWEDDELQELTTELSAKTPVRYRTFFNYPREDLDA